MEDWIANLVAFVHDYRSFDFGTRSISEMKVATPECRIEVKADDRWDRLIELATYFADSDQ